MEKDKKEAEKNKNRMEDRIDIKAEETPQINTIKKPNDAPPTLNDDNDPPVNWHLESGDKINEYGG